MAPWRRPMCCGRRGRCQGSSPSRFATRSGELVARREESWIWLDFPRIYLAPLELDPPMGRLLAASRCAHWRPAPSSCWSWPARRRSARSPRFSRPAGAAGPGIMVTAPSSRKEDDFVSRYFAPGSEWTRIR